MYIHFPSWSVEYSKIDLYLVTNPIYDLNESMNVFNNQLNLFSIGIKFKIVTYGEIILIPSWKLIFSIVQWNYKRVYFI